MEIFLFLGETCRNSREKESFCISKGKTNEIFFLAKMKNWKILFCFIGNIAKRDRTELFSVMVCASKWKLAQQCSECWYYAADGSLGHSHMGTPGLSTPAFQENTAGNVPNYCWSETQHGFGISCQWSSAVVQHRYSLDPTEKQHHFLWSVFRSIFLG